MGAYLATVKMPFLTGLPRDLAENTWWFDDDGTPGQEIDVATEIMAFLGLVYNTATGGFNLGNFLSEYIVRDRVNVDIHTVTTATTPPWEYFPVVSGVHLEMSDAAAGAGLPLEVALCLTYGATDPAPGTIESVPARNRRGRVYFGPFQNPVDEISDKSVPNDELIATMIAAVQAAAASLEDSPTGTTWIVQSRKDAASLPGSSNFWPVSGGWVDNEWDTQRRRGTAATIRSLFGIGA